MASDLAVRENVLEQPAAQSGGSEVVPRRRCPALGRALVPLALVVLSSLAPLVGDDVAQRSGRSLLGGLAALTLFAAVTQRRGSTRLGLGLTATVAASAVLPWQVGWWPLPGLVGVAVYLVAHSLTREPGGHHAVLRLGRLTAADIWMVVGVVVSSGAVLLLFSRLAPPRVGTGASFLTTLTPVSLVAAGVAFAVVNAFVEEFLFRGAMMHHLGPVLGGWTAVVVQALAFGMLHLNGYPYGPAGVVLASVYGVLLGAIRLRSGGLLAPWIAHAVTDVVIFVLIVGAAT